MILNSKLYLSVLLGLLGYLNISAFTPFQQKEAFKQQVDSTSSVLGGNETTANFRTSFKLSNNTILDRAYNDELKSDGINGYYNINLDFEASTKVLKRDNLKLKIKSTIDENTNSAIQSSLISVSWERLSDSKLGYSFSLTHTGKHYHPTLEYIMLKNNLSLSKKLTYRWASNSGSSIKSHGFDISNSTVWSYSESLIENNFLKLDWVLETKAANIFKLSLFNDYTNVGGAFNILKDIEISASKYTNKGISLSYELGKPKTLKTNFELTARELLNANGYSFSVDPSWNVSQNLELNLGLNLHHYRFNKDETLRLVLPYFKSSYTLNPSLSFEIASQYNSETDRLALNSTLKYEINKGHNLELAYYHKKIVEIANPFLKPAAQNDNMVFLKYSYSFAN